MVFDAHARAFAFFKSACTGGIYDNMKSAVETIFVGKERACNRHFQQMCSHYLFDPFACPPASGWEEVGLVRKSFFAPRLPGQELRRVKRLTAGSVASPRQGPPPSGAK